MVATVSLPLVEALVAQRQLVFGVSLLLVVLAEVGFWFFNVGFWIRIVVPLIWVGVLVHNNALLILHELWELNDQISGRKDDFRKVVSRQAPDREQE